MKRSANDGHRLRVFLCHCAKDKAIVRDLHSRLQNDGFAPWLDEIELLPGQDWRECIPAAVRRSHVVLICLSNEFNKSGYRQREVRLAREVAEEQPEGTIFLIPVRLEDCDVPESLGRWQYVSLSQVDGYERLLESLKTRSYALSRNRQLYRLLFMITARSGGDGRRLLLVTNNNPGWRVGTQPAELSRPDTAYLLPYLEDASFDDRAGGADLSYALGMESSAVELTIEPLVFRSTKYNPVFECDTDYSFRFAQVRLIRPVAALQSSRPELSLRPHQFEWHSLQFLMAHKPTQDLNSDVLDEMARRFGLDLQGTSLSLEKPVPVELDDWP
jgi:hypothetical protein